MNKAIEHDYHNVANNCHLLESLMFMMLGHMRETHTDGITVQFIILFDFDYQRTNVKIL